MNHCFQTPVGNSHSTHSWRFDLKQVLKYVNYTDIEAVGVLIVALQDQRFYYLTIVRVFSVLR